MDINKIMEILPHRYPFLLVDKIIELVPGEKAVGIKNLTINEPFFAGHFPGRPIMPGVLMIESMAQVGACALLGQEKYQDKLAFLAGVDNMRFKRLAVPGDRLVITSNVVRVKGNFGKFSAQIKIDDELICQGDLMFGMEKSN
ncbi:3-hydroxyacyl-[acyl-carrier-protein] dehydratase, FabZ form [Candidatus Syntrophocurvum alkaliphilum]|uniref:3-hydroxyacyl-[acyl-carrier-protein] dehydratase FabZ n=1 Tax=Candidatus Syntrophocurvum alkaliphilum TaxID=2293317 RepID=A0A6I6DC08_9FIRM|nr:3-hydroxyacyl-ACP dehydratase FabZ [Candidatus Syntrophocurvum alkaliphilum]QGT98710.1 3-hydroxyacyl-[acyl-carrier-protein] dehydratase, FabZ form [Candidatus Syntrophocurvum alkaliphilum]